MKKLFIIIFLLSFVCSGCKRNSRGYNIELWENTEAWNFAKCISRGNFEKAEEMLSKSHLDVDFREPTYGETLLHWAVYNDNIDAVKFLVDHGATPNCHDYYNGESPMICAAKGYSSIEILRYLLEHGGAPNDYVKENETMRHGRILETPLIGASFTSLEKTKMLVEAGGDPNFAVEPGRTAYFYSALSLRKSILEYLLLNYKIDYKKTYTITIDKDTLYLKELIDTERVILPEDTIRLKRIREYLDWITHKNR